MMLFNVLPKEIVSAILDNVDYVMLQEIRLRVGCPIVICINGEYGFLCENGWTRSSEIAMFATEKMLSEFMFKASNFSIYAVNNNLKQGFITLCGGERVGVCGEVVIENGVVQTIKNISSINIRVPHTAQGCAKKVVKFMKRNERWYHSTLIISPPGAGKTTLLRDIANEIYKQNPFLNMLILDERGEITAPHNAKSTLCEGIGFDVVFGANKAFGFESGIRAMRPDVIITDEIGGNGDEFAIEKAGTMGVSIVASVHGKDVADIAKKQNFDRIVKNKIFGRYVVLSTRKGIGTIENIYDENFKNIYFSE